MSWEEEEDTSAGMTRRQWVRAGMGFGTIGALGAVGASTIGQLIPPPLRFDGEVRDTLHYTKFPTPQWWNGLREQPVRVSDFEEEWMGATGVWRGLFRGGKLLPGTGFPVMVIRVKRDIANFKVPLPEALPAAPPVGYSLFYDDEARDVRIVVVFDRCVHLCCYPGWHVVDDPPPDRGYVAYSPTWEIYRRDPIYCVCHGSQYEPMSLVVNFNEKSSASYVGAERVHGPAHRALPIVPVKASNEVLIGAMPENDGKPDPRWYVYCA